MSKSVEEIAAGLSEAQRAAFARSADADMHPSNAGRISTYGDMAVAQQLFAMGLISRPGTFALATPLGLAVRAHIESQSHD